MKKTLIRWLYTFGILIVPIFYVIVLWLFGMLNNDFDQAVMLYMAGITLNIGIILAMTTVNKLIKCTHVGRCNVSELERYADDERDDMCKVYVDTPAGRMLYLKTTYRSAIKNYYIGKLVKIHVNPRNVRQYYLGSPMPLIIASLVFVGFGIVVGTMVLLGMPA